MKALILAGGRGTRLRPLTNTQNKHLLPIANQPMIMRIILDAIDLGIDEIVININKGDIELPNVLGDGSDHGVKFHYIEQEEPNGMMYPIKLAQDILGEDEFFFSAGDNVLAGGLKKHYRDFKNKKADAHILVVKRPDYQNFGVGVLEGDRLVKTVEKPKEFVSDLVLTAIYFFSPKVYGAFDHIKPIDPKDTGKPEYYPPTVNNWMIEQGYKFTASEVTGWWKDTGLPEDLIAANAFVLDKRDDFLINDSATIDESMEIGDVEVGQNSKIINSTLQGPVSISADCHVENSTIGPYTSIASGCIIKDCRIENSIVFEGAQIEGVDGTISDSIIGRDTLINKREDDLPRTRFLIGDNSNLSV